MIKLSNSDRAKEWYTQNTAKACSNVREYQKKNPTKVRQWRENRIARKREKGECLGCPELARPGKTKCFKCSLTDRQAVMRLPPLEREKAIAAALAFKGFCECCGSSNHKGRDWHVDHNHETLKFRGILCNHCNALIGFSEEKLTTLDAAKDYLTKHNDKT